MALTQKQKERKMGTAILKFAKKNNLVIHPGVGMEYYIDSYMKDNRCPCDPNRPNCPCPESKQDIEKEGHCLCCLFWKDIDSFETSHWPPLKSEPSDKEDQSHDEK